MKHWSMQKKLTAIVVVCMFLPVLLVSAMVLEDWNRREIGDKADVLQTQGLQLQLQVERMTELCTVTTQVYLQDSGLKEYLQRLQRKANITNQDMYDFSSTHIPFIESIVAANPYIDHVRVYASESDIQEYFPILFGQERLREIGWDSYIPGKPCWLLDYTDQLFSTQTEHLMGLISPIRGNDNSLLGTIEVAVSMSELFPELFEEQSSAVLVTQDGAYYGNADLREVFSERDEETDIATWETTVEGRPVLALAVQLPTMQCTYYAALDLSVSYQQAYQVQAFATVSVVIAGVALWLLVRFVMKRMLRQLYLVLDGVAQFIQGDTDTEIPIVAKDEIGEFTAQVNLMLGSIRDFIQRQINQEVLIKNTQIKALQNQINAHFIHNVLESIKMMAVIEDKREIATAITSLSKLLRYTMEWRRPLVTLRDELEYVNNYVDLLNLRFDGQVSVVCAIDSELMDQVIPKVSIQPLVENAIVHGDRGYEERRIYITATQQGRDIHISITTDGAPPDKEALDRMRASIEGKRISGGSAGNGIGLHNIQERMHQNFGERYGLIAQEGITLILPRRSWEGRGDVYGIGPDCRG